MSILTLLGRLKIKLNYVAGILMAHCQIGLEQREASGSRREFGSISTNLSRGRLSKSLSAGVILRSHSIHHNDIL